MQISIPTAPVANTTFLQGAVSALVTFFAVVRAARAVESGRQPDAQTLATLGLNKLPIH